MLDIIQNNPYRLLGIYSNSPTKERVANHNRLKAFLKVGKIVSFALDLPELLSTITRTTEIVSDADAKLTLPNEQLRYAQFWFVMVTSLDDIAMNHLIVGNTDMAISIWEKKDNVSSLQNRIACALIRGNYTMAFACAEKLYTSYVTDFINMVLGECNTVDGSNLEFIFLDELCSEVGAKEIIPYLQNKDWKRYVVDKAIKPFISILQSAIDTAKTSKGKGAVVRYNAGIKLINETKSTFAQLKALLPVSDLQYQVIVDKLGLEILQCGIDYYNSSEATDAAHKAMKLQSYALSVVVGKMAKDRCKENVDILQDIINNLPPAEVFTEDKAIKEELRKFCQRPTRICFAITLLNETKPHLTSIKEKLGIDNSYYLQLSTQVVGSALHNVIEAVNKVQNNCMIITSPLRLSNDIELASIKSALHAAWNAMDQMDNFDMKCDFKELHYKKNRNILKGICEQLGVSINIHAVQQKPKLLNTKSTEQKIVRKKIVQEKYNNKESNVFDVILSWGFIISIIITLIAFKLNN